MHRKFKLIHFYSSINSPIENDKDPSFNLFNNIEEIKAIYKIYPEMSKQIFFFNKKRIEDILYEEEIIFQFEMIDFQQNKKFYISELFYLDLLVTNNLEMINYSYEVKYIFEINNIFFKKGNLKSFQNILISKMLLDIIKNHESDESFEPNDSLDEIIEEKKKLIEDELKKIEIFDELKYTYDDIFEKKIDEIYTDIIVHFIKNNKFDENNLKILKELDIENIYITKRMYKGISKCFEEFNKKSYPYKIDNSESLTKENIYFYYAIIKYIFKNQFYIYDIPIFKENYLRMIKLLTKEMSNNNDISKSDENTYLFDSYYGTRNFDISSFNYSKNTPSVNISSMDGEKINEEEGEKINVTEDEERANDIYGFKDDNIDQDNAESALEKTKVIFDYNSNNNSNSEENFKYKISEIAIGKNNKPVDKSFFKKWNHKLYTKENKIYYNFGKLVDYINEIKKIISENNLYYTPKIELELTKEAQYNDNYDDQNKKDIFNITCVSSFKNKYSEEITSFKDYNVLINGIDGQPYGILYLVNELSNDDYKSD